ncbi:hypothetical protein NDU88_005294 [Pleurodeles waltl]|uniref:Uncharacterized protein n=1 Tax=Pleurodeles waltl TaxID=8319 RepID=A0AAV7L0B1_PLEWA|nr:hypothetical protein NDU88_005294 [Pleurodeles waltl]
METIPERGTVSWLARAKYRKDEKREALTGDRWGQSDRRLEHGSLSSLFEPTTHPEALAIPQMAPRLDIHLTHSVPALPAYGP